MRQISGGDALFLYTDKQSRHQHISMLYIYDQSELKDGPLRFKSILEWVAERISSSPVYRQRLVEVPLNLDYPYWINDPDFDLEFHVRHIALPEPGDLRQLCIQLTRLHSRPLDMGRPLWEMYVIEGLNNIDFLPEGSFAIMTKVHHVAIDGVSGAELTMGLHDLAPYPAAERRIPRWRPGQEPKKSALLVRALRNNVVSSLTSGRRIMGKLRQSLHSEGPAGQQQPHRIDANPITRFNQKISPHRVWDAVRFELDDFKQIKNSVAGATVNDVVLTVCGGAMTRCLADKNELPELFLSSNVPGPTETRYFQGARMEKSYPVSGIMPMTALNVTVYSYDGTLYMGLIASRRALPHLEDLKSCMDEIYAEYREALLSPASRTVS